jgi:hypothetical protein
VVPGGPVFELVDEAGEPMVGVFIQLEVLAGDGRLSTYSIQTDPRGRAGAIWVLGRTTGATQRLRASHGALTAEATAEAVAAAPGSIFQGRLGYVEYRPGRLPLVLTAPHGGYLEPSEIPNRGWGVTGRDRNTQELTLAIRDALHSRTGAYPHVIISHLHRIKLDPNREIMEAAQGDPYAERAWWEFQIFADEAGFLVEDDFGEGLHLDIHGHGHAINRLELGYLLSRTDLAQTDASLADLVRGPFSLGTLMEQRFVPAVPSTSQPNPGQDDYFTGGYNTVRHGSRDGGSISGIQIEHHYPGLRDEAQNREQYAEALADALLAFFPAHLGFELAPPGGN